jgi:hypothetical protein
MFRFKFSPTLMGTSWLQNHPQYDGPFPFKFSPTLMGTIQLLMNLRLNSNRFHSNLAPR